MTTQQTHDYSTRAQETERRQQGHKKQNEDNIEHMTQKEDNKGTRNRTTTTRAQETERRQQGYKKQNKDNIEHKTQNEDNKGTRNRTKTT